MEIEPLQQTITARVGRQIMLVRTARGVLQKDLAAEAGLCQSQLSGMEKGQRTIDIERLSDIARVLNCSIVDLLPESARGRRQA
jgi:transcriptional regulator with XRE-family HTH domain